MPCVRRDLPGACREDAVSGKEGGGRQAGEEDELKAALAKEPGGG
jgi:hypothetical protein